MGKRILGGTFLLLFLGFMGNKFLNGTEHLEGNGMLIVFLIIIVLALILIVRKIMFY